MSIASPQNVPPTAADAATPAAGAFQFGVNEMRLTPRECLIVAAIVLTCVMAIPRLWRHAERFDTGPDYRIPYALSNDYWLYQRRLEQLSTTGAIPVVGDSVVWGEYVLPTGTLSHFLNEQARQPSAFANCGVNGLFPLAMEGLIAHYAGPLRDRKMILHCNVLWMTSPRADLSASKEDAFNHSRLVPQWPGEIPSYRADASERLSAAIERNVDFFGWVTHLENAYFNQHSIPRWTLLDDGRDPPAYPNAWRGPLTPVTMTIPPEPPTDAQRGPDSPRHVRWDHDGPAATRFEWVDLDRSLQWMAFLRTLGQLRRRGIDTLVVLGPFNEHMIAPDQLPTYRSLRDTIVKAITRNGIACIAPAPLPSELYADASHPLTAGYALLAKQLWQDGAFQRWLQTPPAPPPRW